MKNLSKITSVSIAAALCVLASGPISGLRAEDGATYKGRSNRSSGGRSGGVGQPGSRGGLDADMRRELERRLEENEDRVKDKDRNKDHDKNTPPDWARWSQSDRDKWQKDAEKYRAKLQEAAKARKGVGEEDSKAAVALMDSLVAQGVEPKDASAAINGLMEKGLKGTDLTKAFEGFGSGAATGSSDATKSLDGGGVAGALRAKLDDLMKGKGAALLDILQDSGVTAPSAPSPAPMPEGNHPVDVVDLGGSTPRIVAAKDLTSQRAPKKGKIR